MLFHWGLFEWNFISVDKTSCNHYPNWNAYANPSKYGSYWNAAEMRRHVNRTCSHAGLKSQTGMSSFRLFCEPWNLWTYSMCYFNIYKNVVFICLGLSQHRMSVKKLSTWSLLLAPVISYCIEYFFQKKNYHAAQFDDAFFRLQKVSYGYWIISALSLKFYYK